MTVQLRFGYNDGIPEGRAVAWGARLIVTQQDDVDFVWDRMDAVGADEPRLRLLDELSLRIPTPVLKERLSRLLADGEMLTTRADEKTLFHDFVVTVKANTQASAGYCYVAAFFTEQTDEVIRS